MKKIGFIILAVVMALGAMGAGYAAWSQTLTVNGTVNAGSYIVALSAPTPTPTDNTKTAYLTTANEGNSSFDVTVNNGYPGFTGTVTFAVTNTGTIPAKLTDVVLTPNGGTAITGWTGTAQSFHLTNGTANDVTVSYASTPSLPTIGSGNLTKDTAYNITLTIAIPNTLTGTTDAGGNVTGTFKIEFKTDQNPAS